MKKLLWIGLISLVNLSLGYEAIAQVNYPGNKPGVAKAEKRGDRFILHNNALSLSFFFRGKRLVPAVFKDEAKPEALDLSGTPLFRLLLGNGTILTSRDFTIDQEPVVGTITGNLHAVNEAGHLDGKNISATLNNQAAGITIHWAATLLNGSNYVRQLFVFRTTRPVKVEKIELVDLPVVTGVKKIGTIDGSPLVHHNMFFAIEHPMSQTDQDKDSFWEYLARLKPIVPDTLLTISSVWGVTPAGQLRRGFLYYIERERAVPYRQMLHYNSWFDISWGDRKLNDSVCLDRIKTYDDSLVIKRNIRLKAFLFDDGWDDNKTLWQFNAGFPDGFTKLRAAAAAADAGLGVWISPWGGYDVAKQQRMAYGKKQNPPFETNAHGFSLTGPVYYNRFKQVTTNFIKKYGVIMFKFDGVGAGNGASGASIAYQQDIEALLKLTTQLREAEPNLYLSLTVGTWPSVYWLKYGDAIWRAGDDTGLGGAGPKRQQWITYKDGQCYQNVVERAPLYPLNSVMYHGICIADNGQPGTLEMDDKDISDEIWDFFGNGTGLQELYINPHKLNTADWDCLRDAVNWSRAHVAELNDIHWVGGNPLKGQVYGFAGWHDKEGVLTLRNPTAQMQTFTVDVKNVFELPAGYRTDYEFSDAKDKTHQRLYHGGKFNVTLAPFEVKILNAGEL